MKKLVAVFVFALALCGAAGAASADPSATVCHSVTVTVNGENVVNDQACNVLPPQ